MVGNLIRKIIPERFRPIGYLQHLTRKRTGCSVRRGPFAGMRYINVSHGSAYIPKLLGIYERELAPQVEALVARAPLILVDIGAAEGYYAIGFARLLPTTSIIAFEMDPIGRSALREMAALNGVSARIQIRGKCEPADLVAALSDKQNTVVVCDVEGYEQILLDPRVVPALSRAAVLVELHDCFIPNITETLKARFAGTHRITHIWQEPRSSKDFPWRTLVTTLLPNSYLNWTVSEWRPVRMAWLWMEPNSV